jgi:DNA-binding HxlR family transcriptional regulator
MKKLTLADCPVRAMIKVMGTKWRPLILYNLLEQPRHFGELRRLLGATQKVLTEDLRGLEHQGIIERRVDEGAIPHRVEYSLSAYGETLRPVLSAMCEWGERHRAQHPSLHANAAGMPDSRDTIGPS